MKYWLGNIEMEGSGERLVLLSYEKPCNQGDLACALSQGFPTIATYDLVTSSISGVWGQLDHVCDRLVLFIELQWKLEELCKDSYSTLSSCNWVKCKRVCYFFFLFLKKNFPELLTEQNKVSHDLNFLIKAVLSVG